MNNALAFVQLEKNGIYFDNVTCDDEHEMLINLHLYQCSNKYFQME